MKGSQFATDWVAYNAVRLPEEPALASIDSKQSVTWGQLEDRVSRLASLLRDELRVGRGDRVSMLAENDTRVFELQFATMRIGAIFVPLNWRLAIPELAFQLHDTDPAVLFHDDAWRDYGIQALGEASVGASTGLRRLPRVNWETPQGAEIDYEDALRSSGRILPSGTDLFDDPTHILYTSGTTGKPKGAITTRGSLQWQVFNVAQVTDIVSPGCRVLVQQPLFHAGGLHTLANPVLYFGGCAVTAQRFEADECLRLMTDPKEGITHFVGVQTMFSRIASLPEFAKADLSNLRHTHLAGSTPPPEFFEAWATRGVRVQQFYGGTEVGPAVTALPARDVLRKFSCGLPVPHSQVRVVDPASGEDVEPGGVGECWVRGPSVTPGYWKMEDRRGEFFTDDWFHTGDAVRVDDEGYFYVVGRYKDMYKSGGENVYAAEVELVLSALSQIDEVAIIGVPDAEWGEVGRAVVVLVPGGSVTLDEVRAHCEGKLARYKMPKSVVVVEELVRNATGKVSKADLRERYGDPVP